MKRLGIVVRDSRPEILASVAEVESWCHSNGITGIADHESAAMVNWTGETITRALLMQGVDAVVTLGGDGTLIGMARFAKGQSPVMIGVNFGRLGFLTEISPPELLGVLDLLRVGKLNTKTRIMLHVAVQRAGKNVFESQAVNDIVIQKGARERLLQLDVAVEQSPLMRLRADGLIFSTPTGSTAYSMAAGGSIIYPSLELVLLTPICPHSLTNRPIILPLDSAFSVTIPDYEGEVFVSADGQIATKVEVGDKIIVSKAHGLVCFARSPHKSYYEILREKLGWGESLVDEGIVPLRGQ
jgi:NAD+ kinase